MIAPTYGSNEILVAIIALAVFLTIVVLLVRERVLSRRARQGFLRTLARFRALEWISGLGKERQKRLTYRADFDDRDAGA